MTFSSSTGAVTLHGATEIHLGPISSPASPFQDDKLRENSKYALGVQPDRWAM